MAELMEAKKWVPRTKLGRMVIEGKIASLDEIFNQGLKIQEAEIVDVLAQELQQEVLDINLIQKQTDAGEKTRFKALVVLGNNNGYFGLGVGKAKQVRNAIQKGITDAKLNIIPVKRGCGSWECGCGELHSVPFKVKGKCGSVRIVLIPASKGLGIVAGDIPKTILSMTGIKDCWTKTRGSTRTAPSLAYAIYDALKNTYGVVTPKDWLR